MAEIILSSVAEGILRMLGSLGVQEIGLLWGVKDELEQLQDTVSAIKAELVDAEKKQNHNHQVKFWLQRLQEVVLDADDLVDDISTEALRQSLMPGNINMVKQVRTFFSSSNQLVFRHKMGHKIKDVRKKLAAIGNDRIQLNLEESHGEAKVVTRLRDHTHSFVSEKEVIGRDDDRMAILQHLLDTETKENLSIIPIVGIGGLGKTTLAQLVFNNEQVHKHFDLRLWVCVSEDFDVKLLVEKIIKSADMTVEKNMEMEQLQKILRERINGKRYLLVLDDVWNEDHMKWHNLKSLLLNGGEGSKIIVTTRSKVVARITGTMQAYGLKVMDKEKSWALFKKIAFEQGQESMISSNILEIGMHILDKCGGIPLAIRTIGGLLRLKNPETEWSSFMEKELSKIPQREDDIIPTLKLSYDHLPSNLKQCFVYFSLFPKDYVIDVEILVHCWIAQGFIKISDPSDCLEDVGYEYFKELFWRSFFEEVEIDEKGNVTKCKMHDLMHDLAESMTRPEFDMRNGNTEPIDNKTRHVLLYKYDFDLVRKIQPSLIQAKKMRTILRPDLYEPWYRHYSGGESTCDAIALNLKLLRMLDLQFCWIEKVPKSIGKLKHLRYLDLSFNNFKALPNCITRLHNLQTLKLNACYMLQVLPKGIHKLINLRSLDIDKCYSMKYMPRGIGELSSLRLLSKFTLRQGMSFFSKHQSGGLDELRRLNNLRGELRIENLSKDAIVQPKDAILKEKQHLRYLYLEWIHVELEKITEAVAEGHEMQLDSLEPHPNLKHLSLSYYHGVRFPSWFHLLTNLVTLSLWSCYKCQHLPPLHQFLSDGLKSPTSLKNLKIEWCPNFKYLYPGIQHLTSLQHLEICDCKQLDMSNDEAHAITMWQPLQGLLSLKFNGLPLLLDLPSGLQHLTSLQKLEISCCENLVSLPEWIKSFTSLQRLHLESCPKLASLPEEITSLTSLHTLVIADCKILSPRCEWEKGEDWPKISHIPHWQVSGTTHHCISEIYTSSLGCCGLRINRM